MENNNYSKEKILEEIIVIQKILNIERMPTVKEVQKYNRRLSNAITDNGGYFNLAEEFGFQKKRHREWTIEEVESGILESISILNLNRMPTHEEIISLCGNHKLAVAISRNIGQINWD